jgi:aerobic-type carbon monoxide dehydrogenase small subunit (CoxS/CutS family)
MTSHNLLARNAKLDEDSVRRAISGNICRCTGYANIVEAIMKAANSEGDGGTPDSKRISNR